MTEIILGLIAIVIALGAWFFPDIRSLIREKMVDSSRSISERIANNEREIFYNQKEKKVNTTMQIIFGIIAVVIVLGAWVFPDTRSLMKEKMADDSRSISEKVVNNEWEKFYNHKEK